jgi:hypothetical protein
MAATGAIIGDASGYWVGRKGGLALLRRYGRVIHFDEAKIGYSSPRRSMRRGVVLRSPGRWNDNRGG